MMRDWIEGGMHGGKGMMAFYRRGEILVKYFTYQLEI